MFACIKPQIRTRITNYLVVLITFKLDFHLGLFQFVVKNDFGFFLGILLHYLIFLRRRLINGICTTILKILRILLVLFLAVVARTIVGLDLCD